jgi:hypothetical protein
MAKGNIFLDKRAHDRILVRLPITFKVMDESTQEKEPQDGGKIQRDAQILDASLGGMYIISEEALKPGDHLNLKLFLHPKEDHLKILADVVWVDHSGAGLRFVAMEQEDVNKLESYLKGLSPKS